MIEAPLPSNEQARLAALQKSGILDTPLEERFERITRLVCRLLGVPMAAVSLVDSDRQWFKSIQGVNATETPRRLAFCAHTILGEEPLVVPDATNDPRFADHPLVTGSPGVQSYLGQPLHAADGNRIGALCAIGKAPRDFSPEDIQMLRDLAALVEREIWETKVSQAQQELIHELHVERRRALVDPLTRMWNREGIMDIFGREYARARASGADLAVLIADVDHFKQVNDTHGHPTGDVVLQQVARRLLSAVRVTDSVGRIGGEEFLVVAPACPDSQIASVAMRLRASVGESPICAHDQQLPVTISVGGTTLMSMSTCTVEDLIRKADEAMYRAKRLGRDRVELAA